MSSREGGASPVETQFLDLESTVIRSFYIFHLRVSTLQFKAF